MGLVVAVGKAIILNVIKGYHRILFGNLGDKNMMISVNFDIHGSV